MIKVVEAPEVYEGLGLSIFLGGGITNCPDWQKEIIELFEKSKFGKHPTNTLYLINPRRADFDVRDPTAAETQIRWEHAYLQMVDAILFWFPKETLCPITLYELGTWTVHPDNKQIFVGCHPEYQRKQDVEIQTNLARPEPLLPIA